MPYTIHLMADKVSDTKLIQITSEVEFEIQLVTRYSVTQVHHITSALYRLLPGELVVVGEMVHAIDVGHDVTELEDFLCAVAKRVA